MTTTPTERRLAITPGPSTMNEFGNIEDAKGDGLLMHGVFLTTRRDPTAAANAQLFLDAHNTYNACGLTPSELLAKLREAEKVLQLASKRLSQEGRSHLTDRGAVGKADTCFDASSEIESFISTLNLPQ